MLYGAIFVLVVAQTIPKEKFGNWATLQILWIAATQLGDYFILNPMIKLAAEDRTQSRDIVGAATVMYLGFLVVLSLGAWLTAPLVGMMFRAEAVAVLMPWMGAMLLSNYIRNVVIRTLQIDYSIERIFFLDVIFFIVVIGLIIMYALKGDMSEPIRMVQANVWGGLASSAFSLVVGWKTLSLRSGSSSAYRRIFKLGIFNAGTGFMQVIQQQLDGAFLGLFRSQEEVGAYAIAKTYFRGFEAIRDAAGFILLPATSEMHVKHDNDGLIRLTEVATLALIVLIVPIVLITEFGADVIFQSIYHGTHNESAPLFRIFNLGAIALPFTIIASNVLLGIGQTRPLYRLTLSNSVLFAILFCVLTYYYGALGAASALTLTSFAYAVTSIRGMNVFVPLTLTGMKKHAGEFRSVLGRFRRTQ